MELRQKIRYNYPQTDILLESAERFWIADLSRYTDNKKKITILEEEVKEITDTKGKTFKVDFLRVDNPDILPVSFAVFDDHQFKRVNNEDDKHCEGCLYPYFTCGNRWVAFLEIKDRTDVSEFRKEAKIQLINTIRIFKSRGIIAQEQLYAIIACPKMKTAFNDMIFTDPIEQKKLKKQTGAIFAATNNLRIEDDETMEILL